MLISQYNSDQLHNIVQNKVIYSNNIQKQNVIFLMDQSKSCLDANKINLKKVKTQLDSKKNIFPESNLSL